MSMCEYIALCKPGVHIGVCSYHMTYHVVMWHSKAVVIKTALGMRLMQEGGCAGAAQAWKPPR